MFLNSVLLEFVKFVAFYVILKALIQFIHLETRRSGSDTCAGVTGILA